MNRSNRALSLVVLLVAVTSIMAQAAPPPLPSSFYGTVLLNGEIVPAGTIVSAWINGVQYVETATTFAGGDSVFLLDVPGDKPDTPAIEGGIEGQTIVFKVAGTETDQTALWSYGTYNRLDLIATITNPDLTITKDDGLSAVLPGETLTYTLTIENVGFGEATGVVITDTLPAQGITFVSASDGGSESGGTVTWPAFDLAMGASVTRTVTIQVDTLLPAGVDTITNTVTVTDDGAHGPDLTPEDNTTSDTNTVLAAPDLTITKTDQRTTFVPPLFLGYNLTIRNVGSQNATGVVVNDTLPACPWLLGTISHGGSESGGIVTWPTFDLAAGASVSRRVYIRVESPFPAGIDTITNTATVTDDGLNGPDPTPGDNSASDTNTVLAAPDLTVSKDDGQTNALPGETLTYTITVNNLGNQDATGVVLSDTLPAQGILFISASDSGSESGGTVTWSVFDLAAGTSVTHTVTIQVEDPPPAGVETITNTVTVTDDGTNGPDPTPENNTASDTDTVRAPDLVISKDDGLTEVQPGDTLTYTLTISNVGLKDATGVLVSDTLPTQGIIFISASDGGSESGGVVTWPAFDLATGASLTRTITAQIENPFPVGIETIINTVTVADDGTNGPDPTPEDNTASDTNTVLAAPDLTVSKDDSQTNALPDETLTYTITINNVGTQDATGVVINDTLAAQGIMLISASDSGSELDGVVTWPTFGLAVGTSVTRTVTIRIDDPLPAGIETITNTATVTDDGTNGPDPTPEDNTASDINSVEAVPDLRITKDDGNVSSVPGNIITYTLTYANVGNQDATGVVITDTVPANTTFSAVSSSSVWSCSDGSPAGTVCTFDMGDLAGGVSGRVIFAVMVDDPLPGGGTQIVNIAAIADDGNNGLDPTPEDNSDDDVNTATVMPDLVIPAVDRSGTTTDFQDLTIQGDVAIQIENTGNLDANEPFQVVIFEDSDTDGIFSAGTDNILGQEVYTDPLTVGQSVWFSIPISGAILFRDNLLYAFVDSGEAIAESDETNNYSNTGQVCEFIPPVGSFNPVVKFHALEGLKVISTPMVVNLTDDNGDGQIDEHDIPDLIFATMPTDQWSGGPIKAISGDDGHELFTAGEPDLIATLNELGVADIDGDNLPEIVAAHSDGYHLIAFEHTGEFKWLSTYDELPGRYDSGGTISIANLDGAGPPEIVVGASVYSADGTLLGDGRDLGGTMGYNSFSAISSVADVDLDGIPEIIAGPSVYRFVGGALTLLWRRSGIFDGFTGIANFDDDPFAEILIVGWGQVYMLNHDGSNAEVWSPQTNGRVFRPGGGAGGAPTIADYDGDGELEIGIAGASRYGVLERDGSVRWTSVTSDHSSNTTGSTPFDFEGDGSVEVVYRDEQFLRIYRGTDGFILFEMPMRSGTATELPVVADVDNDGNAEIAVCSDYLFGGSPLVDTGIYVFEDANDTWVNTRTIWNQHSYHITNINDDATVPLKEENNWERFNNYRQNMPIAGSVFASPDLTASFIRFAEDAGNVTITVRIGNGGANIVGTGVPVSFYDGDPTSGGTLLGTTQTAQNLNPGDFEDVTFTWLAPPLGTYNIYVAADDDGTGAGTGNECDETNNLHWQPCFVGVDLVITKDDGQTTVLPGENVTYTLSVSNVGILPATGVVISDTLPSQGITFVSASDGGSESGGIVTWPTFDLAAGASVTRTVTIQVEDPLPAGVDTIINTVTVTDDGIHGVDLTPDDNEASDITSIILIIDSDGDGVPDDLDNCPNVANPGQEDADNDGFGDVCETCPNDPDKTEAGICGCGVTDTDSDGDGIADCNDECPNDPNKTEPGDCGCGVVDTDSDGDGTPDCNDNCPTDPNKTEPGICDCGVADDDSDGDGTADCIDECPDDPDKTEAGICGCGNPDTDTDGDGTPDCNDNCPTDPNKTEAGICDCGVADTDSDGDGTADCIDNCPDDPDKIDPGVCDCGTPDTDSDGDGTPDCIDNCPADPDKTEPGICGCGVADTDSDGDGTPDCNDNCPNVANPSQEDSDGDGVGDVCEADGDGDGVPDDTDNCPNASNPGQEDADNDGSGDACDGCPADPNKIDPGICGCGVADTDSDGDGTPDCNDNCPADPDKTEAGICDCGVADTDSDGDGIADCNDNCPNVANPGQEDSDNDGLGDACDICLDVDQDTVCDDMDNCPNAANPNQEDADNDGSGDACDSCPADPNKIDSGICGCGVADTDSDGDGTPDCIDNCPNTANPGQEDSDGDGIGDACEPSVGDVSIVKTQEFIDRGTDPFTSTPFVLRGDTISYTIEVTNFFEDAVTLMISDAMSAYVDYMADSLKVYKDGLEVAVSEADIISYDPDSDQWLLDYTFASLGKDETLTIAFDVRVEEDIAEFARIENFALLTAYFVGSDEPIIVDKKSNVVATQVKNPIPEPATLIFLGIGLLGLLVLVRRGWNRRK